MPIENRSRRRQATLSGYGCIALLSVSMAGCGSREGWLSDICAQQSGFEFDRGQVTALQKRIRTDRVVLDPYFSENGRGPVYDWIGERGFLVVEVWNKPSAAPVVMPVDRVDRYSLGPIDANCLPPERVNDPEIAQKLGLGTERCIRYESGVRPSARYVLAMQSTREPRNLSDRIAGVEASRQRYALVDREGGVIGEVPWATFSGTRGMFSQRGNSCARSAEVRAMILKLQPPGDERPSWELMRLY
jgi:hypothetical protein